MTRKFKQPKRLMEYHTHDQSEIVVAAAKDHKCKGCGQWIPRRSTYLRYQAEPDKFETWHTDCARTKKLQASCLEAFFYRERRCQPMDD